MAKTGPTYWRNKVLFDNLNIVMADLMALEEATKGEPLCQPYSIAADGLYTLVETLQRQLKVASRNAFYKQAKAC